MKTSQNQMQDVKVEKKQNAENNTSASTIKIVVKPHQPHPVLIPMHL